MFQIPYPTDDTYNPTTSPGVCDVLRRVTVYCETDDETKAASYTVAVMDAVCAGDYDAIIFERHFPTDLAKVPVLKGNSHDSVTDLPLVLQDELSALTAIVNSSSQQRKMYMVGVIHFVFPCERAYLLFACCVF